MAKEWASFWVDSSTGHTGLDTELNRIELSGRVIFSIIYKRYDEKARAGYTIITYKELPGETGVGLAKGKDK